MLYNHQISMVKTKNIYLYLISLQISSELAGLSCTQGGPWSGWFLVCDPGTRKKKSHWLPMACSSHADCRSLRETNTNLLFLLQPWLKVGILSLPWKTAMITHKTQAYNSHSSFKIPKSASSKPTPLTDIFHFFRIICIY